MNRLILIVLASLALGSGSAYGDLCFQYTSFDVSASDTTFVESMNNLGQIVGQYYTASDGIWHGFLRSEDGNFTTIDITGAAQTGIQTINDNEQLGIYFIYQNGGYSVLRDSTGVDTPINIPGAVYSLVMGNNDLGQSVGYYDTGGSQRGFIRSSDGTLASVDVGSSGVTWITHINNLGESVGTYLGPWTSSGATYSGFYRSANGTITTYNYPEVGAFNTDLVGINDQGLIAGTYSEGTGAHSFLLSGDGSITDLQLPWENKGIVLRQINDSNEVSGFYYDDQGNAHGFLGTVVPEPSTAMIAAIAALSILGRRTSLAGILRFSGLGARAKI